MLTIGTQPNRYIGGVLVPLVLLVGACRAPLPSLTPYEGADPGRWNLETGDRTGEVIESLRVDDDPEVRASAERVREQIMRLEIERNRRLDALDQGETGDADLFSDVLFVGVDATGLAGDDPAAIRNEMIELSIEAEKEGHLGKALQYASIADGIERMSGDIEHGAHEAGTPRRIEGRLARRLDLIRIASPRLALALVEGGPEVETAEPRPVRDEPVATTSDARSVIELIEDRHADRPDRERLLKGGLEEIDAVLMILELNGYADATEVRESVRALEFEPDVHDLDEILTRLDRLETAGELPGGFLVRVFTEGAAGVVDRRTSVIWPDEVERYRRRDRASIPRHRLRNITPK